MTAPAWLRDLPGFVELDGSIDGVGLIDPPIVPSQGPNPTFAHWCLAPGDGRPRWVLTGLQLHTVVSRDPWHLEASLLCPDCQLHGWIRDGVWVMA